MEKETNKASLSECTEKKRRRQSSEAVIVESILLCFAVMGVVLYRFFGLKGIIPVFLGTVGVLIEKLFG